MRSLPGHRGFTLIELLVTLGVLTIVLAIAAPNVQAFIRNSRIAGQTNDLVTLINLARSQAIHEGHIAELCLSHDQISCNSNNWAHGWLVWIDRNDNRVFDSDELSRVTAPIDYYTSADSNNSNNQSFDHIAFLPTGFADLGSGVSSATITLHYKPCSDGLSRQITINASGAIKTQRSDCTG